MIALQMWKVSFPANIEPILLVMATATYETGISGKFGVNMGSVETKNALPLEISMKSTHHKMSFRIVSHPFLS